MDLGCASGAIYARYREMASEMLAHGPPSGPCCATVSNHNMCLDAPAVAPPQAAQWSAPSQAHRSGFLRGRCLVELSEISSRQTIKTKGNQAPSRSRLSLFPLFTHHHSL